MKDEMKTALETAMDEFDRKRSDAAKRQEATKTKETEFSRSVERLFNEVIRPAMEEVENTLGKRNHDCKIIEEKQTGTTDVQQHAAQISLTIKPAPPTGGGYTMMASRTICFAWSGLRARSSSARPALCPYVRSRVCAGRMNP